MNFISRTITGTALILGGLALVVTSFFTTLFLLIYGIPIFIIGLFVLFNKKEDEIEQIRNVKGGKK